MMNRKTILISGGMGGVGRATATRLAENFDVVLLYHTTSMEKVESFISSLPKGNHRAFSCDVTNAADISKVIDAIVDNSDIFGAIQCATSKLVRKPVLDITPQEMSEQFLIEVIGTLNFFKPIIPILKEKKCGVLIGITSMFIEENYNPPRMGPYVPVKFALRGLLRELASELAPYGIRVNAVAPSLMKTELGSDLPERVYEFATEKNPMKSLLTPEVLANVIYFLCSEESRAITGVSIPVTYGETKNL